MIACRSPISTRIVIASPSTTTSPIASGKPRPSFATNVNATKAFRPRPGAIAYARLVNAPIAIVMTPATRQVEVRTASNGSPWPARPGTPANPRIAGFTKMMYDITMNVVRPATVSRARVVPFSAKRKRRPSAEYAAVLMRTLLSEGGEGA